VDGDGVVMRYFQRVHEGLDTAPMLADLAAAPEVWDEYTERTRSPDATMYGTSDCWLRFFPRRTLRTAADYMGEGRCEFYPAWWKLPSIHPIAYSLMGMCNGVELGTCLISRMPPGSMVKPHNDGAGWSARYYNRKFYCILSGNDEVLNVTEDEATVLPVGSITEFNNLVTHAVYNRGDTERINLIITLRSGDA
jgi:hypothetical protein